MSIVVQYRLTETGWAECFVEIDGTSALVTASYLSDALGNLCGAVLAMMHGKESAVAAFEEEPGEFRWRFSRTGRTTMRVQIFSFAELRDDQPDSAGTIVFDAACSTRRFAVALREALQLLLNMYGETGYAEKWAGADFPITSYHRLAAALLQ